MHRPLPKGLTKAGLRTLVARRASNFKKGTIRYKGLEHRGSLIRAFATGAGNPPISGRRTFALTDDGHLLSMRHTTRDIPEYKVELEPNEVEHHLGNKLKDLYEDI